jgi:hypothetical protein
LLDKHRFLNYKWIVNALKTVLEHELCNNFTRKILQDYYILLSDDYTHESFYDGTDKSMKLLSKHHNELVEMINNVQLNNKLIINYKFEDLIKLKKNSKYDFFLKIYNIYKKYDDIIDTMEEYSRFDFLAESICKKLKIDEDQIEFEDDYLALTHPLFLDWVKEDSDWPIYITYREKKRFDKNSNNEKIEVFSGKIEIYFDLDLIPDNHHEIVKNFIIDENSKCNPKCNPRYNSIEIDSFDVAPKKKELLQKYSHRYSVLLKLVSLLMQT